MTHSLRMRICLPAIAAAIAAAMALPAAAAAADVVPGQVIVRYEAGSSPADRADARDDAGARAIEGLGMPRAQLLRITDGDSVSATVRQLEAQPDVAYAEPNQILQPAALPNDPEFLNGNQWGLYNDGQTVDGVTGVPDADIDAPAAWNFTTGLSSTVVAVMDTGAELQHPDLLNELWTNPDDGTTHGYDFIGDNYVKNVPSSMVPDADPTDLSGHGTHVSGIALAEGDNGIGVTGVSQHAGLMSLRICGTYDNGCPNSALIQAINYAAAHGARVVNGSIAGGCSDPAVASALSLHPDTLYVFAAGNGGDDQIGDNNDTTVLDGCTSPANYPCTADQGSGYTANNVICVAATNQSDRRAGFSNYGASSIDLGAPGVNIFSTSSERLLFSDDFESGDISTNWTNTGASTWAASGEAPHNGSFAISDSPGGNYAPNTTNEVISNPVTLGPGYSSCEIDYDRAINLGSGDTFQITVLLDTDSTPDGVPDVSASSTLFNSSHNTLNNQLVSRFFPLDSDFDQGGQLQVRLLLTSNAASQADGVHMDDISLFCFGSPSDNGYEFMNGTSMATPMVTGAAALLFSSDPTATASQVKSQLLTSVDPLPDLAGTTVSGGRLNVYGALISGGSNPAGGGGGGGGSPSSGAGAGAGSGSGATTSTRPNTSFKRKPGRVVRTKKRRAKIVFRFGSSEAGSSFRCRLDRRDYRRCSKKFVRRLRPGRHVLRVKAVSSAGLADATAAVVKFRVRRIGAEL